MSTLEYDEYFRRPFRIQAVQVTKENIEEIAEIIGDINNKPDGDPYIEVDPHKMPNMQRVYLGFYLTKVKGRYRAYSRRVFHELFGRASLEMQPALEYLDDPEKAP